MGPLTAQSEDEDKEDESEESAWRTIGAECCLRPLDLRIAARSERVIQGVAEPAPGPLLSALTERMVPVEAKVNGYQLALES